MKYPVHQSTRTSDTAAWQELILAPDPDVFRREQNAQREAKKKQEQELKELERQMAQMEAGGAGESEGKG